MAERRRKMKEPTENPKVSSEELLADLGNKFLALSGEPDFVTQNGSRLFFTESSKFISLDKLNLVSRGVSPWNIPVELLQSKGWMILQWDTVALLVLRLGREYMVDRVTDIPQLLATAEQENRLFKVSKLALSNNVLLLKG